MTVLHDDGSYYRAPFPEQKYWEADFKRIKDSGLNTGAALGDLGVGGSEMIDHMEHKMISSNRQECHFGLTPGGCTDHPGVWEWLGRFLTETTRDMRNQRHCAGRA